jgi:hypothetical protein
MLVYGGKEVSSPWRWQCGRVSIPIPWSPVGAGTPSPGISSSSLDLLEGESPQYVFGMAEWLGRTRPWSMRLPRPVGEESWRLPRAAIQEAQEAGTPPTLVFEDPKEDCEKPSLLSSPTTGQSKMLEPEEVSLPDVDPSGLRKGDRRGCFGDVFSHSMAETRQKDNSLVQHKITKIMVD